MFPLRDDNPQFLVPYATLGILAANVAVWVLFQGMGFEPTLSRSICQLGLIPGELLGTLPAGSGFALGPNTTCLITGNSSWHTLITSMFMHGGWLHIIGNMWFLWVFGDNVEDAMGHARFVVFYLLCGLAAALLQVTLSPASPIPMVGASGAIGGVMGAYVFLYPRVRVHLLLLLGFFVTTVAVPAYFMLGYWFLIQVFGGFSSLGAQGGGVAFWAHVGGFAAGTLLTPFFRNKQLLLRHPYYGWSKKSIQKSWRRLK